MDPYISPRIQKQSPSFISRKTATLSGVVFLLFLFFGWSSYAGIADRTVGVQWSYVVEPGASLYSVGRDIWLDSKMEKYWIKTHVHDVSLKAGEYSVPEGTSVEDFFTQILTKTPLRGEKQITILPGWHIAEISSHLDTHFSLSSNLLKQEQDILDSVRGDYGFLAGVSTLEWFLYPDTYRVFADASLEQIVRKMLDGFESKIWDQYVWDNELEF